jgi:hypothetical protein
MADEDERGPTGFKKVNIVGGDGDQYARGLVQPTTGIETRPCMVCRSFEKPGLDKMLRHFLSYGCTVLPDGRVQSPRPKAAKQGAGLKIDPKDFGFCRRQGIAVDMGATCTDWEQKRTRSEM